MTISLSMIMIIVVTSCYIYVHLTHHSHSQEMRPRIRCNTIFSLALGILIEDDHPQLGKQSQSTFGSCLSPVEKLPAQEQSNYIHVLSCFVLMWVQSRESPRIVDLFSGRRGTRNCALWGWFSFFSNAEQILLVWTCFLLLDGLQMPIDPPTVAGFDPFEKSWSIGMIIPNIWNNKIPVPNHQPNNDGRGKK